MAVANEANEANAANAANEANEAVVAGPHRSWWRRGWPRSLLGQLLVIVAGAVIASQALTYGLVMAERGDAMRAMLLPYVTADLAASIAMLDRLPAPERADWLPRLSRQHYRLALPATAGATVDRDVDRAGVALATALAGALGQSVSVEPSIEPGMRWRFGLRLADGSLLAVDAVETRTAPARWLGLALMALFLAIGGAGWFAVRQVTGPLRQLAESAARWQPPRPVAPLPETGPREVAGAARAFNRMQQRIAADLVERSQLLAAIAHDLQSPITRLALRAELVDEPILRERIIADLARMQHLVEQGLAYARAARAPDEAPVGVDLGALVDSLVGDYRDAGQRVARIGNAGDPAPALSTRPRALRRVLTNLIDNAVKFAGAAEVRVGWLDGGPMIAVLDRGPGIAAADRARAVEPFRRLDPARDPAIGGSGLGLAIATDLAAHCDARLELQGRPGGGLAAIVRFDGMGRGPAAQPPSRPA